MLDIIRSPSFKSESGQLFVLMLPILLTELTQASYGIIDSVMVGRVSAFDLAAISLGVSIWIPLIVFFLGISMPTSPIVASLIGQNRQADIPRTIQQSLMLMALFGLLASGILRSASSILTLLHIAPELVAATQTFLNGLSWGFPAMTMLLALRNYVEPLGDAKSITVVSLIGAALLVPCNALLIYGYGPIPALGGPGCGYANAIVAWFILLLMLGYVCIHPRYRSIRLYRHWRFDRKLTRQLLTLGIPAAIAIFFETTLFCAAPLALGAFGPLEVSAHQIAFTITVNFFMIPLALSVALSVLIGQCFGQRDFIRLRFITRLGLFYALAFAFLAMIILLVFGHTLIRAFIHDTDVIHIAGPLVICAACYQIMDARQVVCAGILRGIQDTRMTMVITLISYWLIALPAALILSYYYHLKALGFWIGIIIGLSFAALLLTRRVKQQMAQLIE